MLKLAHLKDFPENSYIRQFYGKTHTDAVEQAEKLGGFLFYYEQIMCGKSKTILVCYDKKEVPDEPNSG